jgi:hypothetical protein
MDLEGKKVVVVGLALTGVAVAKFCARRGARVIVTDGAPAEKLAEKMKLLDGVLVTWELGGHDASSFTSADLVVMSPGVPTLPEMTAARSAGVEVIAEIELAYRFFEPGATLIAITGTNGKSTTTALTAHILKSAGRNTQMGGNIGRAIMTLDRQVHDDRAHRQAVRALRSSDILRRQSRQHAAHRRRRSSRERTRRLDRGRGRRVHARELLDVRRARRRAHERHRGSSRSVRHDGALRRDEGPDLGVADAG